MKTIYLIRHAKSDWNHPGLRDFDRPLSPRGLRDAPRMSAFLAQLGVKPDALISSPAQRAKATAGFFAAAFQMPSIDLRKEIYDADEDDLKDLIQNLEEQLNTIFLFGHNPGFTYLANRYTKDYIDNIPTCGIVQIQAPVSTWAAFHEKNAQVVQKWFPKKLFGNE